MLNLAIIKCFVHRKTSKSVSLYECQVSIVRLKLIVVRVAALFFLCRNCGFLFVMDFDNFFNISEFKTRMKCKIWAVNVKYKIVSEIFFALLSDFCKSLYSKVIRFSRTYEIFFSNSLFYHASWQRRKVAQQPPSFCSSLP